MNVTDMLADVGNVTDDQHAIKGPPAYINPIAFSVSAGIVTCLGVLGNLFILIIFSMKKYSAFSYSVYFRILAVADTVFLCLSFNHALESLDQLDPNRSQESLMDKQQITCLVNSFISEVSRMISASLYFIIPFDRIIVCVMPFRFKKFAKPYTARIVCLVLVVFILLMAIPEIMYLSTEADFSKRVDCRTYGDRTLNNFRAFKSFGYSFLIAFGLTLGFNIFLLVKIKSYLKMRKTIRANQTDEQKEARISTYFIFVTLFSVVVVLPLSAFEVARRVANTLSKDEADAIFETDVNAREPIIVIGMLNFSANFYMLLMLWKSVRDSFKSLFPCIFRLRKNKT